jgi:hypothetical protein
MIPGKLIDKACMLAVVVLLQDYLFRIVTSGDVQYRAPSKK